MNLLDAQEWNPAKEVVSVLLEDAQIRIEKIVSFGHITPPDFIYCQCEAEWVSVLQGKGVLYFPDTETTTTLESGEHMLILPGVRHKVTYTSRPCVWLCVFEKQRGATDER